MTRKAPPRTTPPLRFTAVASVADNGVIGADGDLVWRSRDDLQRVKAMTMGHTLVMGRKNFESIGRALPGRRTVVLTRDRDWSAEGVTVVHDAGSGLDGALNAIASETGDGQMFVFGGGEIYAQLLDRCDVLELTEVHAEPRGDAHFPVIDPRVWRETTRENRDGHAWVRYERTGEAADSSLRR